MCEAHAALCHLLRKCGGSNVFSQLKISAGKSGGATTSHEHRNRALRLCWKFVPHARPKHKLSQCWHVKGVWPLAVVSPGQRPPQVGQVLGVEATDLQLCLLTQHLHETAGRPVPQSAKRPADVGNLLRLALIGLQAALFAVSTPCLAVLPTM